ncbi:unnamed protein product, partial [Ectocarpus sp. 12 AP-2014]
ITFHPDDTSAGCDVRPGQPQNIRFVQTFAAQSRRVRKTDRRGPIGWVGDIRSDAQTLCFDPLRAQRCVFPTVALTNSWNSTTKIRCVTKLKALVGRHWCSSTPWRGNTMNLNNSNPNTEKTSNKKSTGKKRIIPEEGMI